VAIRNISSAFYQRLQEASPQIAELIDVDAPGFVARWTTHNRPLTVTRSGVDTRYTPFKGHASSAMEDSTDLSVAQANFVLENTSGDLSRLMAAGQLDDAAVVVWKFHIDTPGAGRMEMFRGTLAGMSYNRKAVQGQARNMWGSVDIDWPLYVYQGGCVWRFGSAGCGFNTASVTMVHTFAALAQITSSALLVVNTGTYTTSGYGANHFQYGKLTMLTGANSGQSRTIRASTGDLVFMSHRFPGAVNSGDSFSVYPGCRKRRDADCTSKYNNAANYNGYDLIPIAEDLFGV